MNKEFLLLTISVNILKRKTIFSKNSFVNFATSILMSINRCLIIFMHLLIITKIVLYINSSRLLDDKSIMKLIKNISRYFRHRQRIQFFIKFITRNFDTLINITYLNIRFHLFRANELKLFSLN